MKRARAPHRGVTVLQPNAMAHRFRSRRRRRARNSHPAWTTFRLRSKCCWASTMPRFAASRCPRAVSRIRAPATLSRFDSSRRSRSSSPPLGPIARSIYAAYASGMPTRPDETPYLAPVPHEELTNVAWQRLEGLAGERDFLRRRLELTATPFQDKDRVGLGVALEAAQRLERLDRAGEVCGGEPERQRGGLGSACGEGGEASAAG